MRAAPTPIALCERNGSSDPERAPVLDPMPPDIGARLNDDRDDWITELPRVENERPLPAPLAIRYGMKPLKLPA
jgi:hypothetical protein